MAGPILSRGCAMGGGAGSGVEGVEGGGGSRVRVGGG